MNKTHWRREMNILAVDDDFVSRKKMNLILSAYGRCDVAMNGAECIEAFNMAHEEGDPYDLITMDVQMPGINGIETVQRIREWEKQHGVPLGKGVKIIMVTVKEDAATVFSSFREGCEAYVSKPFTRESLEKAIAGLQFSKEK